VRRSFHRRGFEESRGSAPGGSHVGPPRWESRRRPSDSGVALDTTDLWLAAAVVGASASTAGGIALWVGFRRRRQHRQLMVEAAARMCVETEVPPIRRLHRELVTILTLQDDAAADLEREPDGDAVARLRWLFARTDPVRLVEAVFGPMPRHLLTPTGKAPPEETADETPQGPEVVSPPAGRPVPRPADYDGLARLCIAMHDTMRAQARLARVILATVGPVDETADAARDALDENLADVLRTARVGRELAQAAQPLAALDEITGAELTLPEDGVPGRGFRPHLREQAFELTRAILWHRAAVTDWCSAPQRREEGRV
jgi:hypothetical protein